MMSSHPPHQRPNAPWPSTSEERRKECTLPRIRHTLSAPTRICGATCCALRHQEFLRKLPPWWIYVGRWLVQPPGGAAECQPSTNALHQGPHYHAQLSLKYNVFIPLWTSSILNCLEAHECDSFVFLHLYHLPTTRTLHTYLGGVGAGYRSASLRLLLLASEGSLKDTWKNRRFLLSEFTILNRLVKTQQETVPEADIQSWLYAENIDAQVHLVGLIIYLKRTNVDSFTRPGK